MTYYGHEYYTNYLFGYPVSNVLDNIPRRAMVVVYV